MVTVKVRRSSSVSEEPSYYQNYRVPMSTGMSVMDVLDYIYENLDGSVAYYDHAACNQGVCGRCAVLVNQKPSLMCQTMVHGDVTLEPLAGPEVIRDLVTHRRGGSADG